MGVRRKSRELIVQAIYALTYSEPDPYSLHLDYLNKYKEVLADLIHEEDFETSSNIFKYAENTLRNMIPKLEELDESINKHLGEYEFDKVGLLELIIMRLAAFEILYEKTPAPVAINEAVEITKKFCAERSPALVNAILDNIAHN